MTRPAEAFYRVKSLCDQEMSDYRIAALTGVPRPTVQRWRHRDEPPSWRNAIHEEWRPADPEAYGYLLGAYLGDGNIVHRPPNGWTLRVACDQRYHALAYEVMNAMETTFPGRTATRFHASSGASDVVQVCHPAIGRAFPQHGPGRKHLRRIALEAWQLKLTHEHPEALIRGLIHSDGCRTENRFRTKLPSGRTAEYSYVRYFFSNLSADIRQIFVEHCELLGIRVTQSNHRNLSVSHRASTAILEALVGPKEWPP
jgi:hypothetical protein